MVNVNDECLVFYIFGLQTVTESAGKIVKLHLKTPRKVLYFFFFQKTGNPE